MSKQQTFSLPKVMHAYGGELRKKAKNRGSRSLLFKNGSMHFSLRSTKAKGPYSFQHSKHREKIKIFIYKFSAKKGAQILSFANVGNHLHLHVKIHNRLLYKAWIRGLTSGIAMITVGLEGFKKLKQSKEKFWDQRPFSRVIQNFKQWLNIKSYIEINQLEGLGMPRAQAEILIKGSRVFFKSTA